jgi:cobalt-zinc-cadmium efflux system membrane fusion protein
MRLVLLTFVLIALSGCSSKPAAEEEHQESTAKAGLLEMTPEAQQHVALKTVRAEIRNLQEYLHVVGTVQPIDSRIGHVRPLARGRVQRIFVKVGDRVQSGQALATFDNMEAGEAIAEYQGAMAELQRRRTRQTAAERVAQREKELSDIGAVAKKTADLSQVEAQSAVDDVRVQESVAAGLASRLKRLGIEQPGGTPTAAEIRAPFAGVVIKAEPAPGELFDADRELFSIADLSRVWVQAEVYEQDLARVQAGQNATISVDTYPGEKFAGTVTYIGDILDPQTRTARVRCEVANLGIRLKLDMFAAIELPTHFRRRALVVPLSAMQEVNGKSVVFIRKSPTQFEMRSVAAGKPLDDITEIESGLREGEEVVTAGSFHLKSIAMSGQIGGEE